MKVVFGFLFFINSVVNFAMAEDWPIYKGNNLFTGNNDELIVKNSVLRWVFRAERHIQNPIVSGDKLYFLDYNQNIYCVEKHSGALLWQGSLPKIAREFRDGGKIVGKVKYPVIRGKLLLLTDSISIYALDKNSGKVVWARTGLQKESYLSDNKFQQKNKFMVASIYSDPSILEDTIFYGTRDVFMARDVISGRELWQNEKIISFAGFPSFYDNYIFTLSIDYVKNSYQILKLNKDNGQVVWQISIPKPVRLFSLVVFKDKLFLPVNDELFAFKNETGELLWRKKYADLITSSPSFTDRELLFSLGNRSIVAVDPENGSLLKEIPIQEQSSPYFVTTRDQIYVAYTHQESKEPGQQGNEKNKVYTKVKALNFQNQNLLWQFTSICEGPPAQPVSSEGVLYVPAGNFLYALGADDLQEKTYFLEKQKLTDTICNSFDNQENNKNKENKDKQQEEEKKHLFDEKAIRNYL